MEPKHTGNSFLIYHQNAKLGDEGYLQASHDLRPEYDWWCHHFQINLMSDGSFETELDEMETFGSSTSHCGGGVIYRPVPKEWRDLPYVVFIEKILDISCARRYHFTGPELMEIDGLKQFLGY